MKNYSAAKLLNTTRFMILQCQLFYCYDSCGVQVTACIVFCCCQRSEETRFSALLLNTAIGHSIFLFRIDNAKSFQCA